LQAAEAMNRQKPDLVIAGGDLVTDGFTSSAKSMEPRWDAYMAMHGAIDAPVHPVIGNHDFIAARPEDGTPPAPDPRAVFLEKFGLERTYLSLDAGGYHLILLDSVQVLPEKRSYVGRIMPDQFEWLKEDLAGVAPETPIVIATHIPLLTAFYQATLGTEKPTPTSRVVTNAKEVLGLFEERNLVLVLQGHTHINELVRWRGITFITGGAVCARWWRGPWYGTEEGFGIVTLDGSDVAWEYVDYGWEARRPPGV
jgi:3',5'-cyclic AMP phosphodiesterase CpdA